MPVLLTQLMSDVYELTNRPDLVSETRVSVRKAIRKVHAADTFKRDLAVHRIQLALHSPLAPDQFRWSIPLSSISPNFRRPKSLSYPNELAPPILQPAPLYDTSVGTAWSRVYVELTPDNLFDGYKSEYANYFYIAGSTLTIRSAYVVDYLDFWYYLWPAFDNTAGTVESWICDQYPEAVIEEAAGAVFKMVGKDDEYNRYQTLFAENIAILRGVDVGENV